MNKFREILARQQVEQQTEKWYRIRHSILTGSNIASVLEANPYFTKIDLLLEKCKPFIESESDNNVAKDWGIKYEGVAIKIYEELYDEIVHKVGLLIHKEYEWIGASPDGLRQSGKLLEIKNVWNRKITEEIPLYYWIQVQMQLEVCDVDECDLFQCKIIEYESEEDYYTDLQSIKKGILNGKYWKLDKYSKHTIHRDRKWFLELALPQLKSFWKDIQYYSSNNRYNQLIKKRKRVNDNLESNKKHRIDYTQQNWNYWVQSNEVRNYILKDTIIDWLNLYAGENYKRDGVHHMNDIMNSTEKNFKQTVIKNLMDRFDTVLIGNYNEKFSSFKAQLTIDEMKKGTPIIINGILHNYDNQTYGIPDLIVRTDYINRICNYKINDLDEDNTSYRIVHIKYSTIEVKNGNITNSNNLKIYKAESAINNLALSNILGNIPTSSFIISRKWKVIDESKKVYHTWQNYIGTIDYDNYDNNILEEANEGIKWMRHLKIHGKSIPITSLYPNMCNSIDYPWHNAKKEIAENIGEITLLWNCGYNQRQTLHEHGIYNWKNIKPELIGFTGKKADTLNAIINVNKSNKFIINNNNECPKYKYMFYIDFETVNEIQYNNENDTIKEMIYMIGIGYIKNNDWISKTFIADKLDIYSERNLINDWFKYIIDLVGNNTFTLCHWSNAEQTMLTKSIKRTGQTLPNNLVWFDLLKYVKDNNIAFKGAFNYGLKSIANACYKNGLIDIKWEDNDVNGAKAMITAWKCHQNLNENEKLIDCREMQEIIKYNEIDFKVLWKLHMLLC